MFFIVNSFERIILLGIYSHLDKNHLDSTLTWTKDYLDKMPLGLKSLGLISLGLKSLGLK